MSKAATAELQAQMLTALQALAPATDASPITPSDTVDLPQEATAIACGGSGGAVKLRTVAGNDRTIAIATGQTIAIRYKRVFLNGTSASGLVALMNSAALASTPAPAPSPTPSPTPVPTPTPTPAPAATPAPSLSLSSAVNQAEGNSGTSTFTWTLTLNRDGSNASYPYSWAVTGSGANPANAADFGGTFPTGSGTFAPGETTKTITVLVMGDTAFEPDETFTLTVNATGLNTVTSTGTISNDDVSQPSLSLSSAVTQAEGNSGTTAFVWTLTLNRDGSTASYPYSWAVTGSGSNPANAADFGGTFPTGSGTFAPGETSKTITLPVSGDTAFEPDETFTLTVDATGLNTVTSTGTISNDDVPQPSLSLSSAVIKPEGNSGTITFAWTLTLNRDGSTASYPYSWAVTGSGANPANAADFGGTLPTGSGTFAPGETTKTITVPVSGDTAFEPDETFTLTVTASGLNTVTSTGTISNDDAALSLVAPKNNLVAVFGDSRAENGTAPARDSQGLKDWLAIHGQYSWLQALSGQKLRIVPWGYFGISGTRSDNWLTSPRQNLAGQVLPANNNGWRSATSTANKSIDDLIATGAGLAIVYDPTNDGYTAAVSYKNLAADTAKGDAFDGTVTRLVKAGVVVVLCNGTPRDVNLDGTLVSGPITNTADRVALRDMLNKLDCQSGDATAMPGVYVADVYTAFQDPGSATAFRNKAGLLSDGVHDNGLGASLRAQAIVNRLSTCPWYQALSPKIVFPATDGLTSQGHAQGAQAPFINSNPTMVPGNNGVSGGTWASAPAASSIVEGWVINPSGAGAITGVATKGIKNARGDWVQKFVFTGQLAAGAGVTIPFQQQLSGTFLEAERSAGRLSLTDTIRLMGWFYVAPGAKGLKNVGLLASLGMDTATKNLTSRTFDSPGLGAEWSNVSNTDPGGQWILAQTNDIRVSDALLDTANGGPGFPTAFTSGGVIWQINLGLPGSTAAQDVNVEVQFGPTGLYRVL